MGAPISRQLLALKKAFVGLASMFGIWKKFIQTHAATKKHSWCCYVESNCVGNCLSIKIWESKFVIQARNVL
jgi:hypothetical protein